MSRPAEQERLLALAAQVPGASNAWQPTTRGYCDAMLVCTGRMSGTRARWTGPITDSGGDLWCGGCKRAHQAR